jgi:hypothetical protein
MTPWSREDKGHPWLRIGPFHPMGNAGPEATSKQLNVRV